LFSGTVRENIGIDGLGDALERKLLALSGLERDIAEFPEGLETRIGEGGIRVSGGQRQRIALARALAVGRGLPPGLLLLDDPFSAVDVDTEGRIVAALREAFLSPAAQEHLATLILCSHRLAAFPHADRVLLIDGGRIVEDGTHDELIAADRTYAHIYRAQHRMERPAQGKVER
jgi:ABC-type multidrug transport system fused ATPase/permease subunit